ncbi:MAG: hypothetical protein IKE22_11530 [Atopobiaceae bacterium]|nr:hypothetical protein [Atopobiaceae bacterium]
MLAKKKTDITYRAFKLTDGLPPWYEDREVEQDGTKRSTWVRKEADGWTIQTLEGVEHASDDDWCIEGVSGEYYPISEKVFRERYESAPDGRWRRISTPLECWLVDTTEPNLMPTWVQKAIARGLIEVRETELTVHATWGDQLAKQGNDVLIHAGDADIYPCKKLIFDTTYEVIE